MPSYKTHENLTELEQRAIDSTINLSDAHPRQALTSPQAAIIDRLPALFKEATSAPLAQLETECKQCYFEAIGQLAAPYSDGRVFSVYSSSVATIAVGFALAELGERAALLHPTFDNIHDLLSRHIDVIELDEPLDPETLVADAVSRGATTVFVTTPNNPTGNYLDETGLTILADRCAAAGVTLCLDTSFRGFDVRAQFDHYAILEAAGTKYILIEDTGKLWPMSELKLGFVAVSPHWRRRIEHALSDILLSVSPFVLAVVRELSIDAMNGGFAALRQLIDDNRATLRRCVAALPGVELLDPNARVSVARIWFRDPMGATHVLERLRAREVYLLPCGQFHWHAPDEGASILRIALSRDRDTIQRACAQLAEIVTEYAAGAR